MKTVIQRVSCAKVEVEGSVVSSINKGLLVLLGVEKGDMEDDIAYISKKISNLRVFEDPASKMNLSVKDVSGEILVVSQFTLLADCRRGNRPSFVDAEEPEKANRIYMKFAESLRLAGIPTSTGQFAASMQVHLTNDGPVTILLDSRKRQAA
jgi:D-aminoacyl-tRNA deacylase